MTKTTKELISKQTTTAFMGKGKNVYLLGEDKDGTKYWLEAPSWDCDWYWGFGYVETYTRNDRPDLSKDINSHQHIDSSFIGQSEYYDMEKQCFRKGEYIHNIYDSPKLAKTTFTESEGWTLSELFKSFYTLKKTAEMFHTGGAHVTTNPCKELLLKNDWENEINQKLIPAITKQIVEILSPKQ